MTLNAKMTMPDLQRYPWKLCLIKYELDINVFVSLNCLFLCKSDLRIACLYEAMEKLTEMITLRVRKTTVFSRCLIKLRFQGYRWKSDIAIFAWRVPEITLTVPLLKKAIRHFSTRFLFHRICPRVILRRNRNENSSIFRGQKFKEYRWKSVVLFDKEDHRD